MKFWKNLIDSLLGLNEPKPTIVEQMRMILDAEAEAAKAAKEKPKAKVAPAPKKPKASPAPKKPAAPKKAKK